MVRLTETIERLREVGQLFEDIAILWEPMPVGIRDRAREGAALIDEVIRELRGEAAEYTVDNKGEEESGKRTGD